MSDPDPNEVARARKLLQMRGSGDLHRKIAVETKIKQLPAHVHAAATAQPGPKGGGGPNAGSGHSGAVDLRMAADNIVLSTVVHGVARHGVDTAFDTSPVTFTSVVHNSMGETGPFTVSWQLDGPQPLEFNSTHTGLHPLETVQLSWPTLEIKGLGEYKISLTVSPEGFPVPYESRTSRKFKVVHPLDYLNDAERAELRRLTGDRLSRAFTAFTDACEQNKAAAKEAAKDGPDFLGLLIEIALGFALPVLAKGIAHMAEELPETASTLQYRIALAALNEERTKQALEIGVKVGKESLKGLIEPLKGEDETDMFLDSIKTHFLKAVDQIDAGLSSLSDEELGVTCAAYAPEVAGPDQFKAAVRDLLEKYKKEVKPIGTTEYRWMNSQEHWTLARVVFLDGTKKLAVIDWVSADAKFETWVDAELEQAALDKFRATPNGKYYHGEPPEIQVNNIADISVIEWSQHLVRH